LQERGFRIPIHALRAIDDHNPPTSNCGGQMQECIYLAHVLDDDDRPLTLLLGVLANLDRKQVRVAAARAPPADRRARPNPEAGRAAAEEIAAAASQDEAREAEGERRLADAARARDQPGMMQSTRLPGTQQGGLGGGMAEEDGVLPRRQDALGVVVGHDANLT